MKHTHAICIGKTMFSARTKILFFCRFALENFSSQTELRLCMSFKNKNSDISNKKSQKSKGKKVFFATLKNKETNFWLLRRREQPRHQFNKRNCEIFIIKIQWDTNVHIIDYQAYRGTLLISTCLYFIEKALP